MVKCKKCGSTEPIKKVIVGNRLDNHIYNKPELGVGSIDQCHCSYISVFSLSAIGFSTYSTSKTHYQVYFRLSP